MKNVLVVEYSQTGQLTAVLDSLLAPLQEPGSGVLVHREVLRPIPAYPFPWPFWSFLDTFPETVAGDPPPLAPLSVGAGTAFDLVIIGFPVWFLSPPPPVTAFLRSEAGRRLVRGRPVVTVTACRNMWLMAQETMKQLLKDSGACHCDHVALVQPGKRPGHFHHHAALAVDGPQERFLGIRPGRCRGGRDPGVRAFRPRAARGAGQRRRATARADAARPARLRRRSPADHERAGGPAQLSPLVQDPAARRTPRGAVAPGAACFLSRISAFAHHHRGAAFDAGAGSPPATLATKAELRSSFVRTAVWFRLSPDGVMS